MVAYAPGTQGWGDQCAPSKSIAGGVFDELFAVNNLLAKGWAVVVTDYPGLGTPGLHLYNVGMAEGLLRFGGKRIEDYTVGHVNPIGSPEWKAVLDANNLGATAPSAPLLQFHGLVDEIIPLRVETSLHQRYCAAGVRTLLKEYAGGHVLTHPLAQADVVRWLGDRLGGAPAPRNC